MLTSTFPSPASDASISKYVGSSARIPVGSIPGPDTLTLLASAAGSILTLNGLLGIGFPPNVILIVWVPE